MEQNRNRAYLRHQRNRVIAKKVKIFTEFWGNELIVFKNEETSTFPVGKWSKGKVHCSCKMCKYEKHYKIPKEKDKAKQQAMKKEVDDYYTDGE